MVVIVAVAVNTSSPFWRARTRTGWRPVAVAPSAAGVVSIQQGEFSSA
ncbi:hypothetical protein [Streptomyces sp. NPDC059979]